MVKHRIAAIGAVIFIAVALSSAQAYDVTEHVWVGGVIAGTYQYQFLTEEEDGADEGGGAVPLQPEIGLRLTAADTIFVKFGFAADDGLNAKSPFTVSPWVADLEAEVKNINGLASLCHLSPPRQGGSFLVCLVALQLLKDAFFRSMALF